MQKNRRGIPKSVTSIPNALSSITVSQINTTIQTQKTIIDSGQQEHAFTTRDYKNILKLSPFSQLPPYLVEQRLKSSHSTNTEGFISHPSLRVVSSTTNIKDTKQLFPAKIPIQSKSLADLDEESQIIRTFRGLPMQTIKEIYETDRNELERLSSTDMKQIPESRIAPIRPNLKYPNIQEFRKYFKENERYEELQEFYKVDKNIYYNMTEKIKQTKLMPREMKLFQPNTESLSANNLLGSDLYVDLFSKGLSSSHFHNLKSLQLKNNKLNNTRIAMVAKNLPNSLLELDLSNNTIGIDGIQSVCQFLQSKTCFLQTLNLEDNKLKDGQVIEILKSLEKSTTIKIIKLSKNLISDGSMEQFASLLKNSLSLQELYLHYNQIRNSGGCSFFKGLLRNQYLKVLDLSFNKLGKHTECVRLISEILGKPHPELTHIDLSYNNFSNEDAKLFHQQIMFNQIIYGFHFEGNGNYQINARGFLVNIQELSQEYQQLIEKQQIRMSTQQLYDEQQDKIQLNNKIVKLEQHFQICDPSQFKRIDSTNCTNNKTIDNCWICEGWVEQRFQYIIGKSGTIQDSPIYLHLDFENYRPMIMEKDEQIYSLVRMCPPNCKIRYFFSNPFLDLQFTAKDQRIIALDDIEPLKIQGIPLIYSDSSIIYSQKISIVNYINVNQNKKIFDSKKHYIPTIISRPRVQENIIYIDPNKEKIKTWSIENSIFKDFQADTEGHLIDCFDFDFECGRLQKHIPDIQELEMLKDKVKIIYKHILACYKYYCAETLNYDIPCINQQGFIDFISQTGILTKQILNNIDLQLTFLSSYVIQRQVEFINVLDKCLVRYQFLEIIIRLAKEQYLRTNICSNIIEALETLFEQDKVLELIQQFGIPQDWRDTRYWTQLMDATIKMKLQLLQLLYDYVSKLTFKHRKYITPIDMKLFIEQIDLGKYISEKELYLIFLQSMQTQKDELRESRYLEMDLLEFIESIARLAEKISPISPMYAKRNPDVSKITRKSFPLFVKFEGMLYIIFQKIKQQLITKTNEAQIQMLEKDIVGKTILKTVQAKKLGVFEEDRSSDEEKEKEVKNIPLLPEQRDEDELKIKKSNGTGWSKLRNVAHSKTQKKQENLEQVNMLRQLQTYQEEEEQMLQGEYEKAAIYEKMEIKQRLKMKQEFQRTKLNKEPTFKFEELDEIKKVLI